MTTFTVTPSELESAAGALSSITAQLANIGDIGSIDGAGAENPQLESAISEFIAAWVGGMRAVSQSLSVVTGNVSSGASSYHSTDSTISGIIGG
jgi:hypothetical protein